MSKITKISNEIEELKKLNNSELDFLKKDILDMDKVEEFKNKKIDLRDKLNNSLNSICFSEEQKKIIIVKLKELLELENEIGELYKNKLFSIQDNLISINTERKLRETYGKGGMNFLTIVDKNLK
ncbi:MAG: hypothetical protein JXM74_05895 [Fusobacteriaceae bacterium]|nr:hypothetical protein [Fusobacteriaceae bacterium]MBN2838269.1 hypothetical protein [Fusobacteriaceae bacterium]